MRAMNERWAPLVGHEDRYEVSTDGNVRHKPWRGGGAVTNLKPFFNKGYPYIGIRQGKKSLKVPIHRAVLMAFAGAPAEGEEACHMDGNRANPRLINLAWGTHLTNVSHQKLHGTSLDGDKNAASKLKPRDIADIKALLASGTYQKEIALRYGICQQNVSMIKHGRTWAHLDARLVQHTRLEVL